MLTKWCCAFPGLPEEVPHARRFVAALLDDQGEGPRGFRTGF
jgi:serine/threonine-protein kinase RsbW